MAAELDPAAVARRLTELRATYVPEHLDAARERLPRERPRTTEAFAVTASRSLAELRALCELARHLHERMR